VSYSIDTNVVLRLLVRDIEKQYVTAKNLVEGAKKAVGVADIVFIELEYALTKHYGLTRAEVADLLLGLISHPKISANSELFIRVFDDYVAHPALSFTDICLPVYARLNSQSPLYTFDKKMVKQLEGVRLA
jgi:predicted nucleic-acid-binding protein